LVAIVTQLAIENGEPLFQFDNDADVFDDEEWAVDQSCTKSIPDSMYISFQQL
jgi:hypothetical protein